MRVVDVTSFFSDSCGGIKTYYREKARYLPAWGVDCHFVVPGAGPARSAPRRRCLHRLPGPRLSRQPAIPAVRAGGGAGRLWWLGCAPMSSRWAATTACRAIVGAGGHRGPHRGGGGIFPQRHRLHPGGAAGCDAGRPGCPGPCWPGSGAGCGRNTRATTSPWSRPGHAAGLLRDHGVAPVRWVGLGVDVEVFRPRPRPEGSATPRLVYAGRLSADKGIGLLLQAWRRIHRCTGAELHILGEGPARARLLRFARTRPHLKVHGHIDDRGRLAEQLAGADAAITPGAAETFSLGTAEAMACGTPVVAADGGGAGELVGRLAAAACRSRPARRRRWRPR